MTVSRLVAPSNWGSIGSRSRISSGSIRSSGAAVQPYHKTSRRRFTGSARRSAASELSGLKDVLKISDEVADAIATNKPVVALESTIYTHGAFEEDLGLEDIVRDLGAVPAVCGVYDGVATVGLEKREIREMVRGKAAKISRRDLAVIVGDGLRGVKRHGGTTIAGTMILARLAGIRVFGTGGLGGVHRGGESSMDISADLTELGRTRVAVVCSGCKGFLDIPRTLEYLETQGVVVSTFAAGRAPGAVVNFPAFWARDSGVKSPSLVRDPRDAAYRIYAQEKLGIESGLLLANPIPEEAAIPREVMEDAIDRAVRDAEREGYTGSNNTPFILQRIKEYTEGCSVEANLALVRSNVSTAARVAERLSAMLKDGPSGRDSYTLRPSEEKPISVSVRGRFPGGIRGPSSSSPVKTGQAVPLEEKLKPSTPSGHGSTSRQGPDNEDDQRADIVVAGSIALDLSCDYTAPAGEGSKSPQMCTSNPAAITQSVGGVGHNVALAAHRFGGGAVKVKLCSVIADDVAGATVLEAMRTSGLPTSGIRKLSPERCTGVRTAQYVAVNDAHKSLVLAMADMNIISTHGFSPEHWIATLEHAQPKCIVVDANLAADAIQPALSAAAGRARRIFEPVSAAKSVRLFGGPERLGVYPGHVVDLATPNIYELSAMHDAVQQRGYFHDAPDWHAAVDRFNIRGRELDYKGYFDEMMASTSTEVREADVPRKVLHLLPYIPSIVVKLGDQGCLLAEIMGPDDERLVRPLDPDEVPAYVEQQSYVLTKATSGADSGGIGGVYMRYYRPDEMVQDVVSVNGVGDTFLGVLAAGLARGAKLHRMIGPAQKAAVMTLRSKEAVNPHLGKLSHYLSSISGGGAPTPTGVEVVAAPLNDGLEPTEASEDKSTVRDPGTPGDAALESSATGNNEQPISPTSEEAEIPAGEQKSSTAETWPGSTAAVKITQSARQIPVPRRIHEALAKMGVSEEQADEAVRAVAADGPRAFAKWRADYMAEVAAQKVDAKTKARKVTNLDTGPQKQQRWGSFAKHIVPKGQNVRSGRSWRFKR